MKAKEVSEQIDFIQSQIASCHVISAIKKNALNDRRYIGRRFRSELRETEWAALDSEYYSAPRRGHRGL